MSTTLSLQLLGTPRVWVDGVVQELPTRKLLALLAHLALCGGATRAQVVALLWSTQASAEGRRNLRQELHRLRATPMAAWLRADDDRLQLKDGFQLDVERWRSGLALPTTDLAGGPPTLLDGLGDIKGADGFAEWLEQERDALRRQWAGAAARRAAACEEAGQLDDALALVQAQLVAQPLDERHHRKAMQLLHRQGQRAAALEQFQRCRQLLREELQKEPDAESLALEQRIRDSGPSSVAAPAAAGSLHAPLIGRD